MTKIYLVAGEPSGDVLGAKLIESLKRAFPDVQLFGIGGESMAGQGFHSLFDIKPLSVMGLMEVVPSIPKVLNCLNQVVADIIEVQPDIVMTIDSYSFSIRVHKKLKALKVPFKHVHVVAPQVWAWKAGRVKDVAKFIDHLFCLLPYEKKYFESLVPCTYVGHPIVENGFYLWHKSDCRKMLGIAQEITVLTMLPGSRRSEVKYLLPLFKQAVSQFVVGRPNVFVLVPTVQTVAETVKESLKDWSVPHMILEGQDRRYQGFVASDMALAASGTVSLELAMAGVPHVIAYRVNRLTAWMAKRWLKIKYVNLINLISDKEVIPELLQEKCSVRELVFALQQLTFSPHQETKWALKQLGFEQEYTPTQRIALTVKEILKNGR